MAYVKLDCGILDSTLWVDRDAREVFITALLMAQPFVLEKATNQIEVRTLKSTGFTVPPGPYGFIAAAGVGIIRRAGVEDQEAGLNALERLGKPEADSRTPSFGGRRLVRIDGGYLVLNFDKHRQRDRTAAERQKRYREAQKLQAVTRDKRNEVTQAVSTKQEAGSMVSNAGSTTSSTSLVPTKDHPLTAQSVLATLEHLTEQSDIQKTLRTWQIRAIFAYWVKVMKKDNKRVLLSKDRWVKIDKYLRLYQIEACLYAIDGALTHPDLNHESGRSYHELEQIFLKGSDGPGRVEKLSDYAERRHRKRKHRLLKAHPQLEGKEPDDGTPGDDEGRDPRGPATPDARVGGSGSEAKPGTSHQPRDRSASSGADSNGDDSGNADSESSGSDRG